LKVRLLNKPLIIKYFVCLSYSRGVISLISANQFQYPRTWYVISEKLYFIFMVWRNYSHRIEFGKFSSQFYGEYFWLNRMQRFIQNLYKKLKYQRKNAWLDEVVWCLAFGIFVPISGFSLFPHLCFLPLYDTLNQH